MSLMQFVRIFGARRWLIVAATVSTLIGALIVTAILPPRWEAHARVMLNIMKPDPVTGEVIAAQGGGLYAQTQIELLTDNSVAGQVAEQLGWTTDPNLIASYQKRSKSDQRDFKSWLAQIIEDNTKAKLLENSNILDIMYTGTSASGAKAVAGVLRKVYLDNNLLTRKEDAERNAEWYAQQAAKAKVALDEAINVESAFERENGVFMANDKVDADSARFQALATAGAMPNMSPVEAPPNVQADMELAQIDAQIAAGAKILGPNNPEMLALHAKRTALAANAAQQRANINVAAAHANSGVGALDRALAAQKSKVIADSPKIGRLTQLQNDVNLRREELERLSQRLAMFQQQAVVSDAGISSLGPPSTPKSPSFPNYLLIIPGALLLGAGIGILLGLLMELLARRVRGVEDLSALKDLPLVGVIGAPENTRGKGWRGLLANRRPIFGRPRKAVTA